MKACDTSRQIERNRFDFARLFARVPPLGGLAKAARCHRGNPPKAKIRTERRPRTFKTTASPRHQVGRGLGGGAKVKEKLSFYPSRNGFEAQQCYKHWYDWMKCRFAKRYILLQVTGRALRHSQTPKPSNSQTLQQTPKLKTFFSPPPEAVFRVTS